jgi:hypothetical protein
MGEVLSHAENKILLRIAFNNIEEHSRDQNLMRNADVFWRENT